VPKPSKSFCPATIQQSTLSWDWFVWADDTIVCSFKTRNRPPNGKSRLTSVELYGNKEMEVMPMETIVLLANYVFKDGVSTHHSSFPMVLIVCRCIPSSS
jgi:hypothetical protein